MTLAQLRDLLVQRQRRTVVTVFAIAFTIGLIVVLLLPKQYEATSTLFVGENRPISIGGTSVQLDEVLARSYAELLESAAVARAAAEAVEPPADSSELEKNVSFEVVTGTRLIHIDVLDGDAERAKELADAYAETFVQTQRTAAARTADTQLSELRTRIETLAREVQRIDDRGRPSDAARREAAATELEAAREAFAAAAQNAALQGSNVSIANTADVPSSPARPRSKLYALLVALFAAVLAAVAGFVRNSLDRRLRDEDELAEIMEAPVLARIPLQSGAAHRTAAAQEAFQFLRTNLSMGAYMNGGVIAVTSSSSGEGKTTVVAGIARALGSAGASVIAVDCDLRRPMLAAAFRVDRRFGVTNVLVGSERPEDLLRETEMPDVQVLPGGPVAPNPVTLITTPVFGQMLDRLRATSNYVLVDTPPVALVADASAVTRAADGVILVVDLERARRDVLIEARAQLRLSNTPLIGIVLNRVREAQDAYGYYRPPGLGRPGAAGNGADESALRRALRRERRESA